MAARKSPAKTKRKSSTTKASSATKRRTVAVKKPAAKAKRTTAKKAVAVKKRTPISVGRKPFTKSQFVAAICDHSGLARKDVVAVLEAVPEIISAHVRKGGPEIFSWPGLLKIQVVKKPATKARKGINPFTGEMMMFKAKPASRRIKIRALKQLKEMAS